jgi:hypothetical protein
MGIISWRSVMGPRSISFWAEAMPVEAKRQIATTSGIDFMAVFAGRCYGV